MDFGNAEYAEWFAHEQIRKAKEVGADGVAVDEIMWKGYWGMQDPENFGDDPEDYRDYKSVDEITQSCYKFLSIVYPIMKAADVELITQAFWEEAQQYQDGVWGETSFRAGDDYGDRDDMDSGIVWYEKMNWLEIVQNLRTIGGKNKSYIWAAWYKQDNMEQLQYALATYMMGKPDNSTCVTFQPQPIFDGGYGSCSTCNLAGYSVGSRTADSISQRF
jgi:hypothetical protein